MKLSVVIPLYNKGRSIGRAISSVLAQTYRDFELIVVDDGSTDESLAIALSFPDPRIRVVRQRNAGVSAARNAGISEARNPYVCFLDADDEWMPDFLMEIAKLIEYRPNASFYTCRYNEVDEAGRVFLGHSQLPDNFWGVIPDFFHSFRKSRSLACSSNICVSKAHITKIGGFPLGIKTGEDLYVWICLALLGPVLHQSKVLVTVHRDAENRTNTRRNPAPPYHLHYFLRFGETDLDQSVKTNASLARYLLQSCLIFSAACAVTGDRNMMRSYSRAASKVSRPHGLIIYIASLLPRSVFLGLRALRNVFTTSR